MDEFVEHFVDCILSVQYIVCVLIFTILLISFRLLTRVLSLHPRRRIGPRHAGIVEEVSMLLVSYPGPVSIDSRLASGHLVAVLSVRLASDPTREYYALGGVFDEDPFRLNAILSIGLFQRCLTALEVGFVYRVSLSGSGRWRASGGQEGQDRLAAQLHQLVVLQGVGVAVALHLDIVSSTTAGPRGDAGAARVDAETGTQTVVPSNRIRVLLP